MQFSALSIGLSKLNQELLLLSKIENNQFNDFKLISFNQVIATKLIDFQELLELKGIKADLYQEGLLPD